MILKECFKLLEFKSFGVCTYLGNVIGISTDSIRKFFIYSSCLAFGSPMLVYLSLAFLINMRKSARQKHSFYYEL